LKDDTLKLFNIKNEIQVIPNFIELDKIKKDDKSPCQRSVMANDEERIITHISNFRKVKRIPDIIAIFNKIQKEIPAKLMMVGEGPEKEKAEHLCRELGIQDKVIFFGNSNEIDTILCQTDLFLEAMACGVPVISSNAGGLPEVNKDGFSGYLSEVGDVDGMAKNAMKILKDDAVLTEFKKNALITAQQFDIKKILPLYEDLYQRAIAKYS
jgi:N-acetyl-alpha-D-glucosaminyl L-malate synthase BshA